MSLEVSLLAASAAPPYFQISRQSIQLNPASHAWCDAAAFSTMLNNAVKTQDTALALDQAVALYRGDFLEGLSVVNSLAFEEWALLRREEYRRQALEALHWLAEYFDRSGETGKALAYAQRMTALDDLNEQGWRLLMRSLALSGQRNAALVQYSTCCNILSRELGVKPEKETTRLYENIRTGKQFESAFLTLANQPEGMALHASEDLEHERRSTRLAGEQALARRAYSEAEVHLAHALELTPAENIAERFDILALREKLHDLRGNRAAQAKILEAMEILLDSLDDDQRKAEYYLRRANYFTATSDYPAAIRSAYAAIDHGRSTQNRAFLADSFFR